MPKLLITGHSTLQCSTSWPCPAHTHTHTPVSCAWCTGWVCGSSPTGSAPHLCDVGPGTCHQTPAGRGRQHGEGHLLVTRDAGCSMCHGPCITGTCWVVCAPALDSAHTNNTLSTLPKHCLACRSCWERMVTPGTNNAAWLVGTNTWLGMFPGLCMPWSTQQHFLTCLSCWQSSGAKSGTVMTCCALLSSLSSWLSSSSCCCCAGRRCCLRAGLRALGRGLVPANPPPAAAAAASTAGLWGRSGIGAPATPRVHTHCGQDHYSI